MSLLFSAVKINKFKIKINSSVEIHLSHNCPSLKPVSCWWEAGIKKAEKGRGGAVWYPANLPIFKVHSHRDQASLPLPALQLAHSIGSGRGRGRGTGRWSLRTSNPVHKAARCAPEPKECIKQLSSFVELTPPPPPNDLSF